MVLYKTLTQERVRKREGEKERVQRVERMCTLYEQVTRDPSLAPHGPPALLVTEPGVATEHCPKLYVKEIWEKEELLCG